MRALLLCLLLPPCALWGQQPSSSPAPDWKAAYEQANAAAKQWREQAQSLKAEAEMLRERVTLLQAEYDALPMRKEEEAKRIEQAKLNDYLMAQQRPHHVRGKVLSVASNGILVSCPHDQNGDWFPENLCFVEIDPSHYLDGQSVDLTAATMPDAYEYVAAGGAHKKIMRLHILIQPDFRSPS